MQIGLDGRRDRVDRPLLPVATPRHTIATALTALALTAVLVALSPAYGTTYDEPPRHINGARVLAFYGGSLTYADFRQDRTGAHLYGALFDVIAAWLHRQLDGDVWTTRHYLNAAFGGIGILATGLLALRCAGFGGGLLAIALLVLSPRYIGHSMNNPKDLPFAALCALALLSFTAVRRAPPFLSWRSAVLIGVALGLPLGVRPGALLYAGYLCVLLATLAVCARTWNARILVPVLARAAIAVTVMFIVGALFWPWAHANPFVRPVQAMFEVSRFDWPGQVLFAGQYIPATNVPWTYLPGWMVVTIPPVVLAGMAFALVETVRRRGVARGWRAALWIVAATPVAAAIARHSTLYDGWRHVLFIYPPLVVLAASGWHDLIMRIARWPVALGIAIGMLITGCLEPLRFIVRNHPNEVVYFNALVGGPRGAFGRFELDYWGNGMLQATAWCARLAGQAGLPLSISGRPYPIVRADSSRFPSLIAQPPEHGRHHMLVQLLRGSPDDLRSFLQRNDALHVVRTADGAPLAVVQRGPRFPEVLRAVSPFLHLGQH